ncbi:MAG: hypothetical protein KBT14_02960 [Proteobacteria bacterium]|nr:hypothetical protein [Candidatus Enterousia onthequi]
MTEENRNKDQVVIGKITEISQNYVTVNTLEWGLVTIKRGENWDCGVSWAGFIKHLKIGDKVDILCTHKTDTPQKPLYGFYTLGSLLSSPARDSRAVARNEQLMNFIENPKQEAVVIDYWYFNNPFHTETPATHIKCWSPVWKNIEFDNYEHIPLRHNDIIVIEKIFSNTLDYYVIENKTLTQERQRIINDVLLCDFNDVERQKILLYPAKAKQK